MTEHSAQSNEFAKSLADLFCSNDLFDSFVRDGIFINKKSANGLLTADDLLSELSRRKLPVIHADLSNRKTTHHIPVIRAIAKTVADKIGTTPGFDPSAIFTPDGPTVAEVLCRMSMRTGSDIVLVIDGIDALLGSRKGRNLLFELKAARDAVNLRSDNPNNACLFVVGFAKDADAVKSMTAYSDPFYGSEMLSFENMQMHWPRP